MDEAVLVLLVVDSTVGLTDDDAQVADACAESTSP